MFLIFALQVLLSAINIAAHHYILDTTTLIEHSWLWMSAAILFFICYFDIKRVRIDDKNKNLYVSNYLKEIVIPFSQIQKITRRKFPRNLIKVQLHDKTVFGDQILFVPLWSGGRSMQNLFISELEERIGLGSMTAYPKP